MPFATIDINIDPVAFHLGGFAVRWYGIMYVVGIVIGAQLAKRFVRRLGASEDDLWSVFPWAVVFGLIGGRLYYVVQNDQMYFLHHPLQIFAVWNGGMAFFGAIAAVALTIAAFAWRRGLAIWPMLDVAALFAAFGQPFGRIGNIVNGDILGYATHLPWGTAYLNPGSFAPELGVAYQPAAAYEILANLVLIAALVLVVRRGTMPGRVTAAYLAGYSITQFVVFFWRANSITALDLKQAQLTAVVTFAASLALWWWLARRYRGVSRGPLAPAGQADGPAPEGRVPDAPVEG